MSILHLAYSALSFAVSFSTVFSYFLILDNNDKYSLGKYSFSNSALNNALRSINFCISSSLINLYVLITVSKSSISFSITTFVISSINNRNCFPSFEKYSRKVVKSSESRKASVFNISPFTLLSSYSSFHFFHSERSINLYFLIIVYTPTSWLLDDNNNSFNPLIRSSIEISCNFSSNNVFTNLTFLCLLNC